jgi:hypothetical protein
MKISRKLKVGLVLRRQDSWTHHLVSPLVGSFENLKKKKAIFEEGQIATIRNNVLCLPPEVTYLAANNE